MSSDVHHVDLPQTPDLEAGHHEPWSLQTINKKASLQLNTPSSQTLALKSSSSSVCPTVVEVHEVKPESESPQKPKPVSKPPPKKKVSKWILWRLWFNTYRKFFVFTFSFNMIGLGLAASGHFPYAAKYAGSIAVANFNFSILMRNEVFGRFLYLFFNTLFAKWPPLWFRLGITSALQHLGGIHSGCALSGIAWLIFKVVNNFKKIDITHPAVLSLGMVTLVTLIISATAAIPWVRNNHHNIFERHHRFIGWIALICTWAFIIIGDLYVPETQSWNLSGNHIARQQDFWFAMGMTVVIALPWFFIRKVPVEIEVPSSKAAIIKFKRGMQQGLLGRISRSPIWEYHLFGIVSEGTNADCHYLVAGVQGDFTKSLVQNPPKALWTRELKLAGVSNSSKLYKRGIRICTGTGIGAALSTCIQSPNWYLIWIGSDQVKTFGPTLSRLIEKHMEPERVCLWDTRKRGGRPDTMKLLKEAYVSWNAEGNSEIMQGCKDAGIPAFGTLWDF
ncbi:hypothetical protein D9756_011520 [Leucocoprinus leucothites]|uniref:Non-ribosomal peptide synthetase n=1 Tax=Leucocoprinus leucothites TaxID=201217 RepID=A0A8H5FP71_9AGAR|nr:hypothetical protein D9756_011520 [Leucoagaricus leucothites]